MLSSAFGCGGGVFETGVMFSDFTAGDGVAGVIFIRFPSDDCCCCSGRGDGTALDVLLLPPV